MAEEVPAQFGVGRGSRTPTGAFSCWSKAGDPGIIWRDRDGQTGISEGQVTLRTLSLGLLTIFLATSCAGGPESSPGRVGDLRGRIVQVEKDQGLIAVAAESDAGEEWFKLAPLTEVQGPGVSGVDGLEPGQRVYVRYLREPRTHPPEVLSITVIKYTLSPKGGGPAGFGAGF